MTDRPLIAAEHLQAAIPHFRGIGEWVGVVRNGLSINAPACLFETTEGVWFAKLESLTDRSESDLATEHRIVNALDKQGFPVPAVMHSDDDRTWRRQGDQALVISEIAKGEDRYGDVTVFAPFRNPMEAWHAGACLARLHTMAPTLPRAAARPWLGMTAQCQLIQDRDAETVLARWRVQQPAVAHRLAPPDVQTRFARYLQTYLGLPAECCERWPMGVIHGDFIKRNLFWEGDDVAAVIDFGLWNIGFWAFDVALALLPCAFDWPELLAGRGEMRHEHFRAMLEGYEAVRPMSDGERAGLLDLIPVARLEFYLGIVAQALEQGDTAKADQFWHLLNATMDWFEAHPDWMKRLL
jgi:Ser/Thr protein kinase RdoA (MazF antagonist)